MIHDLVEALGIRNESLKQGIKYMFVGGICTLLDFFILYVFAECWEINYLASSIFSFLAGVVLNYFLCTYWVFRVRLINRRSLEFSLYVIISLVGLGFNTFVIWFFTACWGIYFMFSKLLAACVTYFWNFFCRKYLLHFRWNKNV
jgi:putative flippase GtrA